MKDLALPDHLPALRAAGVACFKIEGRKKSPLYVATTTDFYRRLLDGTLTPEHRPPVEADLQTVFSRPWTHLFLDSHRDKEVADRDTVGHRGTPIGVVESVRGGNEPRLAFRTNRPLERHDGLQVDLPGHLGKPFGFAVDRLWLARRGQRREEVVQAPAGAWVEVSLPRDHPPLPPGAPVYCSSSQAVKQRYRTAVPKSDALRRRRPIAIELRLRPDGLEAIARLTNVPAAERLEVHALATERLTAARDSAAIEAAARAAFERLGNTAYVLSEFQLVNPDNLFVAVSRLNALRRELVEQLDLAVAARRSSRSAELVRRELASSAPAVAAKSSFAWSLKVDRLDMLEALADSDLEQLDEIVIDIARDSLGDLTAALDAWGTRVGREKLRLALPPLTRKWEEYGLVQKIDRLRGRGWGKWEAANLSAWSYLGIDVAPSGPVSTPGLDLATDWSVYVLNRLAAREVQRLGATRFALSPEDGLANLRTLLREFAHQAVVIVYQDTPQFLAESCAYANLIGGCPGKANCRFESMEMVSSHGERVTALDYHCRTIVLNDGPFCLASRLRDLAAAGAQRLRADFIYRPYTPELVRDRWRAVRAGRPVPGGHSANFDRGLL
jgi:putative protease